MVQTQNFLFLALALFCLTVGVEGLATSKNDSNGRRAFVKDLLVTGTSVATLGLASPVLAAQEKEYRQGNEVTAFNGLAFNYRGSEFGGLDASTLDEPSISYKEFNEKLKAGEVVFVEFLAPDGDVAYATLKDAEQKIRIGEGYPIEQHDGYSSPMFCVRSVKNAGVPYKFTVKGLAKYSQ